MGKAKKAAAAAQDKAAKAAFAAGGIGVSSGQSTDRVGSAGVSAAASAPPGSAPDLLAMFQETAPSPAAASDLLSMMPSSSNVLIPGTATAPAPASASSQASLLDLVPTGAAPVGSELLGLSTADAAASTRSGWLQKQTGVRKIWRPWYAKLSKGVLSWYKYETDAQPRDELVLDKRWVVEACTAGEVDADMLLSGSSSHGCTDNIFVLKMTTDIRVRHYFLVMSITEREEWVAALKAELEKREISPQ
eukprot:SAG31_NODE_9217_length_1315_cov_0.997533_2_plen_247_part_01